MVAITRRKLISIRVKIITLLFVIFFAILYIEDINFSFQSNNEVECVDECKPIFTLEQDESTNDSTLQLPKPMNNENSTTTKIGEKEKSEATSESSPPEPYVSFVAEQVPTTNSQVKSNEITEIPEFKTKEKVTSSTKSPQARQRQRLAMVKYLTQTLDRISKNLDVDSSNAVVEKLSRNNNTSPTVVNYKSPWTWACGADEKCIKVLRHKDAEYVSLDACWLMCGANSNSVLWPKPQKSEIINNETMRFAVKNLLLKNVVAPSLSVEKLSAKAFTIMKQNVKFLYPPTIKNQRSLKQSVVSVSLQIKSDTDTLSLLTDESYILTIKIAPNNKEELEVNISGVTFFGVRHGLETLSQLIMFDDAVNALLIPTWVTIQDYPVFTYRGIMIDTARNFVPIPSIKRVIDGMSYNKLNRLHWHLTDSNSFPFYSTSYPQMTDYGAYSKNEIYYPKEIQELVQYARVRGVKIIPELDAPAHAGNGWQWGEKTPGFGQLALCINYNPYNSMCGQPPCGQLNPINPKTYEVLRGLYFDMLSAFDPDMFHMGGDEVSTKCWDTPQIQEFMKESNVSDLKMLSLLFQRKAFQKLKQAARDMSTKPPIPILWSSSLCKFIAKFPYSELGLINPSDYIFQFWGGSGEAEDLLTLMGLLNANFSLILSNVGQLYLDFGHGSWLGKGHDYRYINWQVLYNFDISPRKTVRNSRLGEIPQILGAEATLWSEKVNEITMESNLWPRGIALAERLWANPNEVSKSPFVYGRLLLQNERMRRRGILVDTRQPKSCLQDTNCENQSEPDPS